MTYLTSTTHKNGLMAGVVDMLYTENNYHKQTWNIMLKKSKKSSTVKSGTALLDRRYAKVGLLVMAFAVLGLISLGMSRAATNTVAAEVEAGVRAGNAGAGATAGASGGASVKFGSAPVGGCALPKYPDTSCTGVPAGVTLVPGNRASWRITEPNTIIDGQDINGCLSIQAPGVVIKRSRIVCNAVRSTIDLYDIKLADGTIVVSSLLVEDTEINCSSGGNGLDVHNATIRRAKIQNCSYGVTSSGSVTVEDSLIHQIKQPAGAINPIGSGVKISGVDNSNATFRHNMIDATGGGWGISAGSQMKGELSISQNYIKGGTRSIACPFNSATSPVVATIRITDNRFTTTAPMADILNFCQDETEIRGNAYYESGQPIR